MFAFLVGVVVGAVAAVLVPAVFNWVKKETDVVKTKLK
jgi:uncharacterized membrane-anchored protein YhcB (DUF1043 family)